MTCVLIELNCEIQHVVKTNVNKTIELRTIYKIIFGGVQKYFGGK